MAPRFPITTMKAARVSLHSNCGRPCFGSGSSLGDDFGQRSSGTCQDSSTASSQALPPETSQDSQDLMRFPRTLWEIPAFLWKTYYVNSPPFLKLLSDALV